MASGSPDVPWQFGELAPCAVASTSTCNRRSISRRSWRIC